MDEIIKNLDFNTAKNLLNKYHIQATDDEIRYLLPILKQNPDVIYNKQKRSAVLQSLPSNLRNKIQSLINQHSL